MTNKDTKVSLKQVTSKTNKSLISTNSNKTINNHGVPIKTIPLKEQYLRSLLIDKGNTNKNKESNSKDSMALKPLQKRAIEFSRINLATLIMRKYSEGIIKGPMTLMRSIIKGPSLMTFLRAWRKFKKIPRKD